MLANIFFCRKEITQQIFFGLKSNPTNLKVIDYKNTEPIATKTCKLLKNENLESLHHLNQNC